MVEITYEEIKDIRIMLDYMITDYKKLAKDMETLSDTLRPVMVKLQIEEESKKKKNDYNCDNCKFFRDDVYVAYPCGACVVTDDFGKPSCWTLKEESNVEHE